MALVESTRICLSKYFVFSGRASRPEYWWFFLFVILVSMLLSFIDVVVFGANVETDDSSGPLSSIFQLLMLLPLLAAGWRRMHDSGRPGWYLLLPAALSYATMFMLLGGVAFFGVLETFVGDVDALRRPAEALGFVGMMVSLLVQLVLVIMMIWWLTRPSEEGTNAYGPPPA